MKTFFQNHWLLLLFLGAFLLRFALAFTIWHPDLNNHIDWGIRLWQYGPANFYNNAVWSYTWPNQPPGTIYIYAAIRKLFECTFWTIFSLKIHHFPIPAFVIFYLEDNLYPAMLKLPAILSDLGIAYLLYRMGNQMLNKSAGLIAAVIFLLNPITWYNSAVWGQTDAVINLPALLAFWFLYKKRPELGLPLMAISLFIKASLAIFLPIFVIYWLCQRIPVSRSLIGIGVAFLLIGLLTIPFSHSEPFSWLFEIYRTKVFTEQLHLITANAFNLWTLVAKIHAKPDSLLLGPLSYQLWGEILFAVCYIPLLITVWKKKDFITVIYVLALTAFSAFMFLTNMHERYLYPLFPVFTLLTALNRKLLPVYITVSFVHLLNLYNFWWVPPIPPLINMLSAFDRVATQVLSLINLVCFGMLVWFFWKIRNNSAKLDIIEKHE